MTPWAVACQAPLSMGFSRQEYWVICHFLLQGIFLSQRTNPGLLHCRQTLYLPSEQPGKPDDKQELLSSCDASRCDSLLLRSTGSGGRNFRSCCTGAQTLYGMWKLLRPGVGPVSRELAGGFLTTGPLVKSSSLFLFKQEKQSIDRLSNLLKVSPLGNTWL